MNVRRMLEWKVLFYTVIMMLTVGTFNLFMDKKSWTEDRIHLGPVDMRLLPSVSTQWCEAMEIHSDHLFVAFKVNENNSISSKPLNLQKVNFQVKLGSSGSNSSMMLQYFLLPSSVIKIKACSTSPGLQLQVFQGDLDVQYCLQILASIEEFKSSGYDDSHKDSTDDIITYDYLPLDLTPEIFCSTLLRQHTVDVGTMDYSSTNCSSDTEILPMKMNVTRADYYVIVARNTNITHSNNVNLQVQLDRTRYTVYGSEQTLVICPPSTPCFIGLDFASGDRVVVSIPEEPNAGRTSYEVRSRCKPRPSSIFICFAFCPLQVVLFVALVDMYTSRFISRCILYTSRFVTKVTPTESQIKGPCV